jgi:hypothetical protein
MQATVDRIERDMAVLLVRPAEVEAILISTSLVPGIKEGDIVTATFTLNEVDTRNAHDRATNLLKELHQKL